VNNEAISFPPSYKKELSGRPVAIRHDSSSYFFFVYSSFVAGPLVSEGSAAVLAARVWS